MTEESKLFCEFIYCGCKCGKTRPTYDKKGRKRQYIDGHQWIGKTRLSQRGENNNRWKGGKAKHPDGYVYRKSPDHPFANYKGYVLEHRLVWEEHNNAILLPWADIHHINEVKNDNHIENLEPVFQRHHLRDRHMRDKSNWCCTVCGSNTTSLRYRKETGYYQTRWYGTSDSNRKCQKCYDKIRRHS